MTYTLRVNDRSHQVTVDFPDTPLLYVLREQFDLKGTRFGCGDGACGACMVLVEGRAQRSCEIPVWSMEGKSITTIEGLGSAGHLHPIQQAILNLQAGQCGYCLSGIIVSAAELVEKENAPTREQIRTALAQNLCRCGAHGRIVNAIETAARRRREGARS